LNRSLLCRDHSAYSFDKKYRSISSCTSAAYISEASAYPHALAIDSVSASSVCWVTEAYHAVSLVDGALDRQEDAEQLRAVA